MGAKTEESFGSLVCLVLSVLIASYFILSADGYFSADLFFHYLVADDIAAGGWWSSISWLPFTMLGEAGPDHHWLWHLLLSLFAYINNEVLAINLALITSAAIVPVAAYYFFKRSFVPFAILFALLVFVGGAVLPGRFLMLRAQNLGLIFLMALVFFAAHRQLFLIFLTSLLFTASYHGAVLIVCICGVAMLHDLLFLKKIELKILIAALLGFLLGMVCSPWYPENIGYFMTHAIYLVLYGDPTLMGREWHSPNFSSLVYSTLLVHILFLVSVALWLFAKFYRRSTVVLPRDTFISLLLMVAFLVLYLGSVRFEEYYAPFCVMSSALLIRDSRMLQGLEFNKSLLVSVVLSIAIAIGIFQFNSIVIKSQRFHVDDYKELVEYADQHIPKGSVLFNDHWSDFQLLVFGLRDYRFVSGLDGHYLKYGDPLRFKVWHDVANLEIAEGASVEGLIMENFDTRWVLVNVGHLALVDYFVKSPRSIARVGSKNIVLFEILEQ